MTGVQTIWFKDRKARRDSVGRLLLLGMQAAEGTWAAVPVPCPLCGGKLLRFNLARPCEVGRIVTVVKATPEMLVGTFSLMPAGQAILSCQECETSMTAAVSELEG